MPPRSLPVAPSRIQSHPVSRMRSPREIALCTSVHTQYRALAAEWSSPTRRNSKTPRADWTKRPSWRPRTGTPPPSAVCQKLLLCAQAPGLGQSESERACAVLLLLLAPKRSPARHSLCPLPPSVSPPANPPPLRRPTAVVWTASLVCDGPSHEKEFSPAQTLWI